MKWHRVPALVGRSYASASLETQSDVAIHMHATPLATCPDQSLTVSAPCLRALVKGACVLIQQSHFVSWSASPVYIPRYLPWQSE
jgi:hypothetical protein